MIKRIRIKDYMAHQDTELELGAGVTILTGPNNSGKSAVVEALRSVAQNPVPHHVIRHGASQATVRLELDSGTAIEWVRSRGNTVYRLFKAGQDGNGPEDTPEVYAKFGRMPPEDIRRLLRLDLVETESGSVDIHIGNQRYPIFLLDQTGSQAASFFAASTEAEYLLRMQQALKTKTDRTRSKRKELLQECADLETALELYLPLEDLDIELSATENLYTQLVALQHALPLLQRTIEVLEEMGLQHARKAESSAVLKLLSPSPQPHETKALELTLQEMQSILLQLGRVEAHSGVLKPLSEPPVLHDATRLDGLIRAWESSRTSLESRRLAGATFEILETPPVLHEMKKLEEMVGSLEQADYSRKRTAATGGVLKAMMAPPDTKAVAPLQTLIEQLTAGARSYDLCSSRKGSLEELHDPPELQYLRPLEELTASLQEVQGRLRDTHKLSSFLAELAPCAEPQSVTGGAELLGRMIDLHGQLEANARLQEELASAITAKRQEIEQTIQDLGLCPLCGHALDMDHFLEATHG